MCLTHLLQWVFALSIKEVSVQLFVGTFEGVFSSLYFEEQNFRKNTHSRKVPEGSGGGETNSKERYLELPTKLQSMPHFFPATHLLLFPVPNP